MNIQISVIYFLWEQFDEVVHLVVYYLVGLKQAALCKSICTLGARIAFHAPLVTEVVFHQLDQAAAQLALQAEQNN